VTVEVAKGIRVFGGYGQDKNDRDADPMDRLSFGVYASDLLGTGVDVNVTDYRYQRGSASSYDSWYVSAGRSFGSRLYLSGEYNDVTLCLALRPRRRVSSSRAARRPIALAHRPTSTFLERCHCWWSPTTRATKGTRRRVSCRVCPSGSSGDRSELCGLEQQAGAEKDQDGARDSFQRPAHARPAHVFCRDPTAMPHEPCQTMLIATCVALKTRARAR